MISSLEQSVALGAQVLDAAALEYTLDESAVPFASATVVVPYDPALADSLDPRSAAPARLDLSITQRFSGSSLVSAASAAWVGKSAANLSTLYAGKTAGWISSLFGEPWNAFGIRPSLRTTANLHVRTRQIDHRAATITLGLASDEALLADSGLVSSVGISPSSLTVLAAVQMVLGRVLGTYALSTTEGSQTVSAESAVWQPGVSGWDYLQPITASAGMRLWCDEARLWHLAKPENITAPGQVTLSISGTVTEATDEVSRAGDAWYQAVVVKYQWTDSSNVQHVVYDVAGDSSSGRVLLVEHQDVPWPRGGEAVFRLRKLQGQGRVLGITAEADPSAYPAMASSLSVPDTDVQVGVVSAVTWRLPGDEMTVRSRGLVGAPADSWLAGPDSVTWGSIPDSMTWATFDWSVM